MPEEHCETCAWFNVPEGGLRVGGWQRRRTMSTDDTTCEEPDNAARVNPAAVGPRIDPERKGMLRAERFVDAPRRGKHAHQVNHTRSSMERQSEARQHVSQAWAVLSPSV
eukprot:2218106-Rhodomonas_salina.1